MIRRLHDGSVIDVIAPSSAFDREGFEKGLEKLRAQGWRPRHRPDVFAKDRFLAGGDARRLAELREALAAPDSDLLWCVRGGYGATRLLDALPVDEIRAAGKPIVGFSDITALHALWGRAGVPSLHGTMVARLAVEPAHVVDRELSILRTGRATPLAGQVLIPGAARGPLRGGNLALLAALCGTPHQPDLRGCIVFLEDTGERPYRIDRMLVQCRQAGLFQGIAGLALGQFDACDDPPPATAHGETADTTAVQVLCEHARALGVPAVAELPCGHCAVNHALPFGTLAHLDGERGTLEFPEALWDEPLT